MHEKTNVSEMLRNLFKFFKKKGEMGVKERKAHGRRLLVASESPTPSILVQLPLSTLQTPAGVT